jgi:hypothetical protein
MDPELARRLDEIKMMLQDLREQITDVGEELVAQIRLWSGSSDD